VAWVNVACPTRFGSLGLPNLRTFGMALPLWWLWQERTDPEKMWATFRLPTDRVAQAFFDASVSFEVRDGSRALFWEDNWLAGSFIKLLAPNLWAAVSPRVRRSRTVQEGLSTGPHGICWVADVTHARTMQVMVQFLSIWDLVRAVRLSSEPNKFIWKWSPNGQYSSSSAYVALFLGRVDVLLLFRLCRTLPWSR
jgi:hypothetical protein